MHRLKTKTTVLLITLTSFVPFAAGADETPSLLDLTIERILRDQQPVDLASLGQPPLYAMADSQSTHLSSDGDESGATGVGTYNLNAAHSDCCAAGSRADAHAPIGVMADHPHKAGEMMLSYRYMAMGMQGSRDGSSRISNAEVRAQGYMVVPTKMNMQMHMFGMMWAPSDDFTLMAMLPYIRYSMDHQAGMPLGAVKFKTTSEGIGDLKLASLIPLHDDGVHHWLGTVGFSLPTGSINMKDNTPAGYGRLPYPMQLGSGTVDFVPRLGYTYQAANWSWGNQVSGVIRIDENRFNYTLGDRFEATTWLARNWTESVSTSARLNYQAWGDIRGRDEGLGSMAPTMDPEKRAGERLDILLGINWNFQNGPLEGHRLALEGGVPLHQRLDGPQLETDWILTAGWQFAF